MIRGAEISQKFEVLDVDQRGAKAVSIGLQSIPEHPRSDAYINSKSVLAMDSS